MIATSPCKPTASSPSATGVSCVTRWYGHEHPNDVHLTIRAAEQEAHCGDHPGGDPVGRPDLWSVPAGCEFSKGDDRPRDLHVGKLARTIPRRAIPKRKIYHRKQRCPDGHAELLARERHLRQPKRSSALPVCHGI